MSRTRTRKKTASNSKQIEAEKRNHFLRYLKFILVESGCERVYEVLTPELKKALYQIRDGSIKIRREDCSCLTNEEVKLIRGIIDKMMQEKTVTIENSGYCMTFKMFFTYGIILYVLQNWLKDQSESRMQEAYEILVERLNFVAAEKKLRSELYSVCSCIAMLSSELNRSRVKVIVNWGENGSTKKLKGLEFKLSAYSCQQRKFDIKGNVRPAYRVGSFAYHMIYPEWASVKRSLFEDPTMFNHVDIPVYIQMHAINRLTERLDSLSRDCLELFVFLSLQKPIVRFFQGRVLVDYIYGETKLGYLLVEVIDNVLLIKTFLLLTNNATPEGEKLRSLTGLSKVDMKYWNIDRLSTFQKTDISEKEPLKLIFEKAGCENLFSPAVNFLEKAEHQCVAQNLLCYLGEDTN